MDAKSTIELFAHIADLKLGHYQTLSLASALCEILIEKGFLTREELSQKLKAMDLPTEAIR